MAENQVQDVKAKKGRRGGMDGQQKEAIVAQERAHQLWVENWGFLNGEEISKVYREASEKCTGDPDFLTNRKYRNRSIKLDEIDAIPSPGSPPEISSRFIGRRADAKYSLERAGPFYVSPRRTMDPPGEPDQRGYANIFLG